MSLYLVLLQTGFECCHQRGALLPHPFTLTGKPGIAASVCFGGLLSAALSVGLRPPGITWRLVLWSPDFPPPMIYTRKSSAAITRPTPRRMLSPTARRKHTNYSKLSGFILNDQSTIISLLFSNLMNIGRTFGCGFYWQVL